MRKRAGGFAVVCMILLVGLPAYAQEPDAREVLTRAIAAAGGAKLKVPSAFNLSTELAVNGAHNAFNHLRSHIREDRQVQNLGGYLLGN